MKMWTVILIFVIMLLMILIAIFNNYDASPHVSYYFQMETQMRKLWY